VEALKLKTFVAGLPAELPSTVLAGLHLPTDSHSVLAEILQRRCSMEVVKARACRWRRGLPLSLPADQVDTVLVDVVRNAWGGPDGGVNGAGVTLSDTAQDGEQLHGNRP
jgi:hypothetical protein